jgi:predicted DsbA family dithiol-disulfide isomerase
VDLYREIATNFALDVPTFDACWENNDYKNWIENDLDFAFKLGVRGTPTFFINGLALVGAQPAEVFIEVIDAELEKLNNSK